MASYTVTLSKKYPTLATYTQSTITWTTDGYIYGGEWQPTIISIPVWKSGAKKFAGYYHDTSHLQIITEGGLVMAPGITQNASITESWSGVPIAILNSSSSIVGELAFDGGIWYQDYKQKVVLDEYTPLQSLPKKTNYRFLGIYSKNSTTSTQYVDADGYPTDALMTLSITSDKTFYILFELATKTITISASNGTWVSKKIYQDIQTGLYCSKSDGSDEIDRIPVPVRECYRWDGLHKSSSATSTLYANPDGTFTSEFLARSVADATVYGNFWTQMSYKITVDARSGTAPQSAYYISKASGGVYADDLITGSQLTVLRLPSRQGYHFLGYYSATSGGIQYVDSHGIISDDLKTLGKSVTIYARWRAASVTITLDHGGGTSDTDVIYYDTTDAVYFDTQSQIIIEIALPTYTGNVCDGYYDSDGRMTIDDTGEIVAIGQYAPASDATWTARWRIGKSNVHIQSGDGSGGTTIIYYDLGDRKYYADADMTQEISSVTLPTLKLYDCDGLYDESGTQVVDADGVILPSLDPRVEDAYIDARYTRRVYEITLDANGGTMQIQYLYYDALDRGISGVYLDEYLQSQVTRVDVARVGHTYLGSTYGDTTIIDDTGSILDVATTIGDDYTATAQWYTNTYTMTFLTQGGTIPYDSKNVRYGSRIGALPTPSWGGRKFLGWAVDGVIISSTSIYSWGEDKLAIAQWEGAWGYVKDYWALGSDTLIPIKSDDGARGEIIHTADRSAQYQIVPHPSVTYMVVGQTDLRATLGALGIGSYMITQVTVSTRLGQPPQVTVSGVANEGQRAIQVYDVRVQVSPRHRAQRLDGAIIDGGDIQECTYTAKCDSVVVYGTDDNGQIVPIASDVVHGILTVSGTLAAYQMESAPTSGNGYTVTQISQECDHIGYKTFNISTEKEI